jgi:hypothetical protein
MLNSIRAGGIAEAWNLKHHSSEISFFLIYLKHCEVVSIPPFHCKRNPK